MHTLRSQKILDNTNLFIYLDTGYGDDNYKNFNFSNKITGFGFGLSYDTFNLCKSNVAVGINQFGGRKIHFSITLAKASRLGFVKATSIEVSNLSDLDQ